MSNYTKENLIAIPPTAVPAGTLAIKVGDEIFTPGNIKIGSGGGDNGTDSGATILLAHFDSSLSFIGAAASCGVAAEQINAMDASMGGTPDKWSPAFDSAKFGQGLLFPQPEGSEEEWEFNRKNHRLILPVSNTLLNGDFTIEFFYKTIAGYDNAGTILSATTDHLIHFGARGPSNSQVLDIGIGNGSAWIMYTGGSSSIKPETGVFHHVALVRNGDYFTAYVDGSQAAQTSVSGTSPVGAGLLTLGSLTSIFEGIVDELRISNTARYTADFTPPASAFVVD